MKLYKNTLALALIVSLVVPATAFVAVPQAEASCSYQGYSSSHGKCDKSKKWDFDHEDDSDDDDWDEDDDDWDEDDDDWDDDDSWEHSKKNRLNHHNNIQINQLLVLIAQLQALLEAQQDDFEDNGSDFNVTTARATDIDDNGAKLRGNVNMGNADDVSVWFEYGENRNQLNRTTSNLANTSSRSVYIEVNDLDEDSQYYFRIVGRDEDNDIDRGAILSFRTDDDSNNSDNESYPDVETDSAKNVTDDSAELRGVADMNDAKNGHSFFVYGEDKDLVSDIEDEYSSFSDVDEDGDDLRKVWGSFGPNVFTNIYSLDDNTVYYFSLCVEYEDEDGDDDVVCGGVEEFETDAN